MADVRMQEETLLAFQSAQPLTLQRCPLILPACCSPGYSRKLLKQHVVGKSLVSTVLASCGSKSTGASAAATQKCGNEMNETLQ